jgi:hypothetical protein
MDICGYRVTKCISALDLTPAVPGTPMWCICAPCSMDIGGYRVTKCIPAPCLADFGGIGVTKCTYALVLTPTVPGAPMWCISAP